MNRKCVLRFVVGIVLSAPVFTFASGAQTIDVTNMMCGQSLTLNIDSNSNETHFYANTGDNSWQNNRVSLYSKAQNIPISNFQVGYQTLMLKLACGGDAGASYSFNIDVPMSVVDRVQIAPEIPDGTTIQVNSPSIYGPVNFIGNEPQLLEVSQGS